MSTFHLQIMFKRLFLSDYTADDPTVRDVGFVGEATI